MIIFLWFVFSILVGIYASKVERSGLYWFLFSCIFSPLIMGLILLFLERRRLEHNPNMPQPSTHLKCPDCKEFVLKDARVCKHCGCKLIPPLD